MMEPEEKIHVAYAISRKGTITPTYRAVAVVWHARTNTWHSRKICLDDTADAAVAGALRYMREDYSRCGAPMPADVVHHGRMAAVDVDSTIFPRMAVR